MHFQVTLAGTPHAGTAGRYRLTLDAEKGVSDPTQSFTLTVENPTTTTTATTTSGATSASVTNNGCKEIRNDHALDDKHGRDSGD